MPKRKVSIQKKPWEDKKKKNSEKSKSSHNTTAVISSPPSNSSQSSNGRSHPKAVSVSDNSFMEDKGELSGCGSSVAEISTDAPYIIVSKGLEKLTFLISYPLFSNISDEQFWLGIMLKAKKPTGSKNDGIYDTICDAMNNKICCEAKLTRFYYDENNKINNEEFKRFYMRKLDLISFSLSKDDVNSLVNVTQELAEEISQLIDVRKQLIEAKIINQVLAFYKKKAYRNYAVDRCIYEKNFAKYIKHKRLGIYRPLILARTFCLFALSGYNHKLSQQQVANILNSAEKKLDYVVSFSGNCEIPLAECVNESLIKRGELIEVLKFYHTKVKAECCRVRSMGMANKYKHLGIYDPCTRWKIFCLFYHLHFEFKYAISNLKRVLRDSIQYNIPLDRYARELKPCRRSSHKHCLSMSCEENGRGKAYHFCAMSKGSYVHQKRYTELLVAQRENV